MNYRKLGRTNIDVSEIGLGTEYLNGQPRDTVVSVVHEAVDNGINYIDLLFAFPEYRDNFSAAIRGKRDKLVITGHLGCVKRTASIEVNKSKSKQKVLRGSADKTKHRIRRCSDDT
jgi:aryl-alcohol dehydrogenase-like predicted oxidoreductase